MMDLYLQDWRAWTPHRDAPSEPRLDSSVKPSGAGVPAMLRRRLNLIGRAICDMLVTLDPESNSLLLHASRHGDGDRTLEMLYTLNEGDPLSPARFGLSVHNAIIGVHSIASGNRRSQQAIAASGGEWAALLMESRGYLADGEREIIVVFGDQPVPARFADYVPSTQSAAVALRLSAHPTPGVRRIVEHPGAGAPEPVQPLDVIDWLLQDEALLACPIARRQWQLEGESSLQASNACKTGARRAESGHN
ncbi:beta-ketoacyl synthase chain length factor [Salinicola rhizosphaerae]|uniref:3-oxoacyl-ACP synthase n=1 Tax=Salinicola rhizosphaerae TaxID=1443141 RepID=A0ABQ3DTP7_9GAMM|nr:beta-ketoacyl synthase chain length factor [Salinicola rhizosphaerae]GHB16090.1 3-oxoacyl-ACP synthase [Salinicola rhizosphaerae]